MELMTELGTRCAVIRVIGQFWERDDIRSLQDSIDALREAGTHRIVLDLERLTFINSIGLGALVRIYSLLAENQSELILFRPAGSVKETMEISDFPRFLRIAWTEEDLAALFGDQLPGT